MIQDAPERYISVNHTVLKVYRMYWYTVYYTGAQDCPTLSFRAFEMHFETDKKNCIRFCSFLLPGFERPRFGTLILEKCLLICDFAPCQIAIR
jgi:hypothetical protein